MDSIFNRRSAERLKGLLDRERGPVARLLLDSRRVFYLALALTGVSQLVSMAPIIYMMNLHDRVLSSRSVTTLVSLTLILVGFYVLDQSVTWLRQRLLLRLSLRLDWDLAARVFDAAFRRCIGHRRVNVQQVMGDVQNLRRFFQGAAFQVLAELPFTPVFVLLILLMHPWLGVLTLFVAVLMVVLAVLKARAVTPLVREASQSASETRRSVAEALRHSESAFALGMQTTLRQQWYRRHQADLMLDANGNETAGMVGALANFVDSLSPRLVMGLAIYLAIQGEVSVGMTVGVLFLVRQVLGPVQSLIRIWPQLVRAVLAFERLEVLLGEDEIWHGRMPLPAPQGFLSVEQLSVVAPRGRRMLLDQVSFALEPGQVLAVTGPSGAGKSTLLRHLVGIHAPSSGAVRLDGAELYTWMRSEDVPHIGYVPQEVMVLEGSIADNIARMQTPDPQAVVAAADAIGFHQTILSFPDGYDTLLGEDGFTLTGGEKQRLLIARALYGSPRLLVMDEPSASLDTASRLALMKLIRRLSRQQVTVVLSTHNPALLQVCDQVLELDQGRMMYWGHPKEWSMRLRAEAIEMVDTASTDDERRLMRRRLRHEMAGGDQAPTGVGVNDAAPPGVPTPATPGEATGQPPELRQAPRHLDGQRVRERRAERQAARSLRQDMRGQRGSKDRLNRPAADADGGDVS